MAPLPVVEGGFYGGIRAAYGGVPIFHTMAWRQTSALPAGQAEGQTIANAIAANWMTNMAPLFPTTYSPIEAFVYELENPERPAFTAAMSGSGSNSPTNVADNVQVLIKHRLNRRGRGVHGRTFLPGMAQGSLNVDGKTIAGADVSNYTSRWNAFTGDVTADVLGIDGATIAFAVLSRRRSDVEPAASSFAEAVIATQRRRLKR